MSNDRRRSAVVSRRAILRNAALTVGGAAILATNASGNLAAAQTKLAQKAVSYQDTPKGVARCDNCKQFAVMFAALAPRMRSAIANSFELAATLGMPHFSL